ncbi:cytosolic sulfotransferase 15-like [Neltuma alba]|uniref:cytosolic sulfotransferase 15-like n=1 Tax=Neltuma alba TaxID=207710 RepID=UPI0010A2BD39|nr:cytosolic sulfotransferase 15-like [Prosopis alba]XP_028789037.1 cytosolic sulfotransferase 15-like [Prosopis alba]
MAATSITSFTKSHPNVELENEESENLSQECKELLLSLPKEKGWDFPYFYLYQDIWYPPTRIQAIISFQKHFQAKDNDVIIASLPKSGTTWLKALVFAIVNRNRFSPSQHNHPLLISNAHDLVPFFEFNHYGNNQIPDLSDLPEPRLFGTHIPFHSLPDSITKCKIIYICRNPFDHFVSFWLFINKVIPPSLPKLSREEALERYSKGANEFGPFWTHMLSYWRESKVTPNKVLFLKYEDLKGDINFCLKRVAEFLGFPFNSEEESNGVIESIIELCSFEKMKELEANKKGKFIQKYENKNFFRKGKVGDWVNHFSPGMQEKLSKVIEDKLGGSGLSF